MSDWKDKEDFAGFASPPCSMHELYGAEAKTFRVDRQQSIDVMRWRKAERGRQIALRLALDPALRRDYSRRIASGLAEAIGDAAGRIVSGYWPMRGEPDLRELLERMIESGARAALPIVSERGRALVFRTWAPGEPLERGFWNVPVPVGGAPVSPDVVIAPVVGFDNGCYRLGYGGGYFDRTLATMTSMPRVFGVGYSLACLPTIYPQPHDIPMDAIVTEHGVRWRDV